MARRGRRATSSARPLPPDELARRAHRDLDEAASTVDAAVAIGEHFLEYDGVLVPDHVLRSGLGIAFGAVALALRRFDEDWNDYLRLLFSSDRRTVGTARALIADAKHRGVIEAANRLVAHRGGRGGPPLSSWERYEILSKGSWGEESAVLEWYSTVADRLASIRDALAAQYPGAARLEAGMRPKVQVTGESVLVMDRLPVPPRPRRNV